MSNYSALTEGSTIAPGWFYEFVRKLSGIALVIAGFLYLAITALVCFDIFARAVLGFSSGATIELTGYMLGAGMTLGMSGALMERAHVRIDVLVQHLPLRARIWLHSISLLALFIVVGFMSWGAVNLAMDSFLMNSADLTSLHLPLSMPQGIWASGLILMVLAIIAIGARTIKLSLSGHADEADALLLSRNDIDEAEETLEALGKHDEAVKLSAMQQEEHIGGSSK